MKEFNSILKEVLEKIKPPEEDLILIDKNLQSFLQKTKEKIKKLKINAEVFVGGSYAKKTLIKKDKYDIDIFMRFQGYEDKELTKLTEKILKPIKYDVVHGSRDYFKVDISKNIFFEIVPVKKITKPEQAENITDLSYSHVNYIRKKVKKTQILDDIRIAKAFCYATKTYGAESYVHGFSGYALELLVYYYKGFLNFIKAISKTDNKLVIDIEKHYKNKNQVMLDLNASKLHSPIILIDPTYKIRNALAALSEETLKRFQKECLDFLKKPQIESFEIKKVNLLKIKEEAQKQNQEFILLEASTNKQKGDIAGSKLLKFYKHLEKEIMKYFDIKNKGFNYAQGKKARYFFVVKNRQEILIEGPKIIDKENVIKFKKKHKKILVKKDRIYAKEKIEDNLKHFIAKWMVKNQRKIKEMSIKRLEII